MKGEFLMNLSKFAKKQLEELEAGRKDAKPGELLPEKPRTNMRDGIESFNNSRNQKPRTFRHHTVNGK